jgi:hypothetical protein
MLLMLFLIDYIVELSILLACLSVVHGQRFGLSGDTEVSMGWA